MQSKSKVLFLALFFYSVKIITMEFTSSSVSYSRLREIEVKEENEIKEFRESEDMPTQLEQIDDFTYKKLDQHLPKELTKIILEYANMKVLYSIQYLHSQTINTEHSYLNNLVALNNNSFTTDTKNREIKLWKPNQDGKYEHTKTLVHNYEFAYTSVKLIQLQNNSVAFIDKSENKIYIWNYNENGEYSHLQTLYHYNTDFCSRLAICFGTTINGNHCINDMIELRNGSLVTTSGLDSKETIKIWKINQDSKYDLVQTIHLNESLDYLIELPNFSIIGCSKDGNIMVFKINQEDNKYHLFEEDVIQLRWPEMIHGIIQFKNGSFGIGTSKSIIVCKFDQHGSLYCDENESISVCIKFTTQLHNESLVSYYQNNIYIWKLDGNIKYYCYQYIENAHNDRINKIIELQDGSFASCSDDKTIKIWKLDETQRCYCYQIINDAHSIMVKNLIQLQDGLIVSSSNSKVIKIWKPKLVPTEIFIMETTSEIDDPESCCDKLCFG